MLRLRSTLLPLLLLAAGAPACTSILGDDFTLDGSAATTGSGGSGPGSSSAAGGAGGVGGSPGPGGAGGTGGAGGQAGGGGEGGGELPGIVGCTGPVLDLFGSADVGEAPLDVDELVLTRTPQGGVHVFAVYGGATDAGIVARTVLPDGSASAVRTKTLGTAFHIVEGSTSSSAFDLFGHRGDQILTIRGTANDQGVVSFGVETEVAAPDGQPGGGGPAAGCEGVDLASFSLTPPADATDTVAVTCDNNLFTGRVGVTGLWHLSSVPPGAQVRSYLGNLPGHMVQTGFSYFFRTNTAENFLLTDRRTLNLSSGVAGVTEPLLTARVGSRVFGLAAFRAQNGDERVYTASAVAADFIAAFPTGIASSGPGPFTQLASLDEIPRTTLPSVHDDRLLVAGLTTKTTTTLRLYLFGIDASLLADLDVYVPPSSVQLTTWGVAHLGANSALVAWLSQEGGPAVVRGCVVEASGA